MPGERYRTLRGGISFPNFLYPLLSALPTGLLDQDELLQLRVRDTNQAGGGGGSIQGVKKRIVTFYIWILLLNCNMMIYKIILKKFSQNYPLIIINHLMMKKNTIQSVIIFYSLKKAIIKGQKSRPWNGF